MAARRTTTTRITARVDHDRGVFMISVAAELAEMHPQTLRMYETRGLIEPKRSPKGTRLYSQADVERLRRIQEMTTEWGMNLAGVERVFELEEQLDRMQRKVASSSAAPSSSRRRSRGSRRSASRSRPRSSATRPPRAPRSSRSVAARRQRGRRSRRAASLSGGRGRACRTHAGRARAAGSTTATPSTIAIAVR